MAASRYRRPPPASAGFRHTEPVSPHHAQLSSTASSLDDLIKRVVAAADDLAGDREDLASDLYEVERSLRTGARRLTTVLRRLDGR